MHILVILWGIAFLRILHRLPIKNSVKMIIIAIALIIFGIFALYSISIYESFDQTLKRIQNGKRSGDPSNYYFFNEQLMNIATALVAVTITYFIPIKRIKNRQVIWVIFIWSVILQLLVFSAWWESYNWSNGWVSLPLIGNMQPAEFFKVWFAVFFASRIVRKNNFVHEYGFYVTMAILMGVIGIIFIFVPDLWSMLIMAITGSTMALYAGAKIKHLLAMAGIGAILALWLVLLTPGKKFEYIKNRLSTFVTAEKSTEQKKTTYFQTYHGLVAIGWWGIRWQWYGKWLQKFGNIPEAQSDFIFAALSEEIGLIGNLFILSLYGFLARYALLTIQDMKDPYYKILGIGILSLIMIQTFINIWVNIDILPNTWITLPFISHWGTALMINMLQVLLLYKLAENK